MSMKIVFCQALGLLAEVTLFCVVVCRESSEARVDSRDSVNKLNETDVLKSVSILS